MPMNSKLYLARYIANFVYSSYLSSGKEDTQVQMIERDQIFLPDFLMLTRRCKLEESRLFVHHHQLKMTSQVKYLSVDPIVAIGGIGQWNQGPKGQLESPAIRVCRDSDSDRLNSVLQNLARELLQTREEIVGIVTSR